MILQASATSDAAVAQLTHACMLRGAGMRADALCPDALCPATCCAEPQRSLRTIFDPAAAAQVRSSGGSNSSNNRRGGSGGRGGGRIVGLDTLKKADHSKWATAGLDCGREVKYYFISRCEHMQMAAAGRPVGSRSCAASVVSYLIHVRAHAGICSVKGATAALPSSVFLPSALSTALTHPGCYPTMRSHCSRPAGVCLYVRMCAAP
jgi:hypothetical protein